MLHLRSTPRFLHGFRHVCGGDSHGASKASNSQLQCRANTCHRLPVGSEKTTPAAALNAMPAVFSGLHDAPRRSPVGGWTRASVTRRKHPRQHSLDSVSFLGAKAGLHSFLSATAKPERIIFYRHGLLRVSGNHCREETCVGLKDQQLEPSGVSVPGALPPRVDAIDARFSSSNAYRISPAAADRRKSACPSWKPIPGSTAYAAPAKHTAVFARTSPREPRRLPRRLQGQHQPAAVQGEHLPQAASRPR
ncbi:uncharacterized protein LOC144099983 [Amblyomma americanum]